MTEHTQISTPAGRFDAITAGDPTDPPVLLLHGFPEAAIAWTGVLPELGHSGWYAVAPDQRGYSPGARPPDVADYRVDELVADALAMADALGWTSFDLVGHGLGAVVGWHAAAAHPDRVRSLTAVSDPHPSAIAAALREDEDQAMRSQYVSVLKDRSAERRLLADNASALRQIYERRPPRSHIEDYVSRLGEEGALTAALNWYRAERWNVAPDRVGVPTMFVWGSEDAVTGSTAALSCGAWVDGPFRFEMLEDVSHWVPEEAPDALVSLIIDHLKQS